MPLPGSRLCLICGQVFGSNAERLAHIAADHPGMRVAWHGREPSIVAADGHETPIGSGALKRMRAAARKVAGGPAPKPRKRRTRPAERSHRARNPKTDPAPVTPEVAPSVEHPLDDPDAPPYFVQTQPPRFDAGGSPVGPPPTGPDGQPAAVPTITRDQLRVELDQPLLAEMLRNVSIVVSEWDGAGVPGQFSHIEARQLAMLLHEPAIDAVQRYFGGNVNRFRLGVAAFVIIIGKGRVHYLAIQRRRLADATTIEAITEAQAAGAAPREAVEVDLPDNGVSRTLDGQEVAVPVDILDLAEKQRQARSAATG